MEANDSREDPQTSSLLGLDYLIERKSARATQPAPTMASAGARHTTSRRFLLRINRNMKGWGPQRDKYSFHRPSALRFMLHGIHTHRPKDAGCGYFTTRPRATTPSLNRNTELRTRFRRRCAPVSQAPYATRSVYLTQKSTLGRKSYARPTR